MRLAIFENIMTPGGHEVEFDRILVEEFRALGHEVEFYVPENFSFQFDYQTPVNRLKGDAVTYTNSRGLKKIFAAAKEKNLHALDAPVTGGDVGAKNATLTILVGGEEKDFEILKPVFEVLGKNIVYEGSAGAGQKTKACNQIAIAGALAGVCEAFAYARASGLDIEKVYSAISTGAAGSFQMTGVARKGLDGDFNPGFMLKHFGKDLSIGLETATAYGKSLPILATVLHEVKKLEESGSGSEGTQALLKYYGVIGNY